VGTADNPVTGSAFEGHKLRVGFFLVPQSPLTLFVAPFVVEGADIVELEDACEARDEDELVLWAVFRGISIRETSSALMLFKPLGASLPELQREMDWKLGGGATAVIGRERLRDSQWQRWRRRYLLFPRCILLSSAGSIT